MSRIHLFFIVLSLCALTGSAQELPEPVKSRDMGPTNILIGNEPNTLWILAQDACRIIQYDTQEQKILKSLPLPLAAPKRIRWLPGRRYIAVVGTRTLVDGLFVAVDTQKKQIADYQIPLGHTPHDICAFQKDGKMRLYAANRFDNTISVFNAEQTEDGEWFFLESIAPKTFPTGREPIALTITPDGKTLIVAHHLPEQVPTTFDASASVQFIDTATGQAKTVRLTNGAINIQDMVLSPDSRYVFVTGIIAHFQRIPDDVNGGWVNENVLFVLDVQGQKLIHTQNLDDYSIGSANPWGVSFSDDEQFIVVAAAGSCDILMIHLPRFLTMLDEYAGYTPRKTETADFPMMMRVPIGLKGVRHAVMSKGRIFATAYFEDALAQIVPVFSTPSRFVPGITPKDTLEIPRKTTFKLRPDVTTPYRNNVRKPQTESLAEEGKRIENSNEFVKIPLASFSLAPGITFERSFTRLGPEPIWEQYRYGEMLFHDAVLCKEHWQSCISCHPDGRSDGVNWDLQNDGQDNPKNTKSLLLSHQTPPSMAHGIRKDAETAVRKGFETILMIPAEEEEAEAIDYYLTHLPPVPSPKRTFSNGLTESARRGERLFNSSRTGCSDCHPAPYFTDMLTHDVGTRSAIDTSELFDTPMLIEVWRTAPYLHDGRYTTIRQVFTEGKHYNSKGQLDKLSETDIDDLVEYVLSL